MKQAIGLPVPDFSLPLLNGRGNRSLADYLKDKQGALIIFWSGVCTHCVRYDGYFNDFGNLHPNLGFVAIASRQNETSEQMTNSVHERNLRFPILVDSSGEIARQWYAQQTPRCYLIAPGQTLIYRGAIDNFKMPADSEYLAYLEPAIKSFLAGEPLTRPETASFGCPIETVYYQLQKQF